jgi:fatty-acyl-CoA synthase
MTGRSVGDIIRAAGVIGRWGSGVASGYIVAAMFSPDRPAIVDEDDVLTFAEVDTRTNALANALAEHGVGQGDRVAIICRNHRGFIEATVSLDKLGTNALYVNIESSASAIADLLARQSVRTVLYDADLYGSGVVSGREFRVEFGEAGTDASVEDLIAAGDPTPPTPPSRRGHHIVLTSGTTGDFKGAVRPQPTTPGQTSAIYSMIPFRPGDATVIAAPLFHSWGLGNLLLSLPLASTIILRRRFDAEETLRAVAAHGAGALVLVPVMLRRILQLTPATLERYDLASLRIIASSGSALDGRLAERAMAVFGDVVYNLYGTTEVAWATIATPADLRAAPGTVGRAPQGTEVRLLDDDLREAAVGERGRIFVSNGFVFEGYTDTSGEEVIDGLVATGDVGHFDGEGRLFLDGRTDEMIVSGGENVYPREVEELLSGHGEIEEAAVVGVPDAEFGQRLRAFVVLRDGSGLDEAGVRSFVKDRLARYKAPRDVVLVEALPRNAAGKVLKRELTVLD